MATLNIHAQESQGKFSCLSASDPENIDVRKEIKYQYTTKAQNSPKSVFLRFVLRLNFPKKIKAPYFECNESNIAF